MGNDNWPNGINRGNKGCNIIPSNLTFTRRKMTKIIAVRIFFNDNKNFLRNSLRKFYPALFDSLGIPFDGLK